MAITLCLGVIVFLLTALNATVVADIINEAIK